MEMSLGQLITNSKAEDSKWILLSNRRLKGPSPCHKDKGKLSDKRLSWRLMQKPFSLLIIIVCDQCACGSDSRFIFFFSQEGFAFFLSPKKYQLS